MAPATIYDVAELAGVSISTVSLALNQPTRVSARTRMRVMEAAHRLEFRPKSEAVSRARSGFRRIGVLSPFTSYASFHRRLDGVLQRLAEVGQGYEAVVFDHESVDGTDSAFADTLPLTDRLDGLILMGVPLSPHAFELVAARRFPVVMVDVGEPRYSLPSVVSDDYRGGGLAAAHLADRLPAGIPGGGSGVPASFVYVGIPQRPTDYVFQSQRREKGFVDELRSRGHNADSVHVFLTRHTIADAEETAVRILEEVALPAAVFCFSDEIAAGVIRAIRRARLRIPEDVSVVGFDDGDLAEALDLTSVQQGLHDSGRAAVDILLAQIRDGAHPVPDMGIPVRVVARTSTAASRA